MLTSDLLNSQVPSRTYNAGGVSNGTLTYTASAGPVEAIVSYQNDANNVTVDGFKINANLTNGAPGEFRAFLGIGQTITVKTGVTPAFLSVRTSP